MRIRWYNYSGEGGPSFRRGGSPWLQWAALAWMALALDAYWNRAIGFAPLADFLK